MTIRLASDNRGPSTGLAIAEWVTRSLTAPALLAMLLLTAPGALTSAPAWAATFLERAQQYFEAGDLNSALVELKNTLQRDPENAEARLLLGKVHLRLGDTASAEKELLRAQELGLQDPELDLMLAYTRLEQRRFESVVSELKSNFTIDSPLERDLYVARGEALLGLGQMDEAQAIFDRVLQDGPHARALVNKARIEMIFDRPQPARALLDQAAAVNPDDPFLATVEAGWQYNARNYAAARDAFARAAELNPNKLLLYVGQIQAHLALGETAQAGRLVKALQASDPDNTLLLLLDSIVKFLDNDHRAAKSAADRVLAVNSRQPQALLVSGYSAYRTGEYEQARAKLTSYLSQFPDDDKVRAVLGAALLQLGYAEEADRTLEGSGADVPDSAEYLNLLTGAAFATGDQQAGRRYLEQLASQKPEDAGVQERLGMARLNSGDPAGARSALEAALALDPARQSVYTDLFSLHLQQKAFGEALDVGRKLQDQFPDGGAGHTLMGLAYLASSDRANASSAFRAALDREPGNVAAATNLANLYRLEGDLDEARRVLDGALSGNPGNLRVLLTYAAMEDGAGNAAKAQQLLLDAVDSNPAALQPKVILARQYLASGRADEALALTQPALATNPTHAALLEVVGRARLQTGAVAGGVQAIEQLAKQSPDDPHVQELLMEAFERSGRIQQALTAAERTLALDGTNERAKLGRVRYLAHLERFEEAKAGLQELRQAHPDEAELMVIEGRIALAEKRVPDAVALFEQAYRRQPETETLSELVKLKFAAGQRDEAVALMQEWTESHPDDLAIRNGLAEAFIGLGRLADAKEQYAAILERSPDNPFILNNLAWLQTVLGEVPQALVSARRAVALAPDNLSFADTLAVALLRSGKAEEALGILQKASAAAPDNPTIQFHYAWALAENGDKDKAIGALDALLKRDVRFAERDRAEQLLKSLN